MTKCRSLDEVRENIDAIDAALVRLLAQRSGLVAQAAAFKSTQADVVVPSRIEAIVAKVRGQAVEDGADPDLMETIFRRMIDTFIEFERSVWRRNHEPN
jgi:isochorismate pyruvate lyase